MGMGFVSWWRGCKNGGSFSGTETSDEGGGVELLWNRRAALLLQRVTVRAWMMSFHSSRHWLARRSALHRNTPAMFRSRQILYFHYKATHGIITREAGVKEFSIFYFIIWCYPWVCAASHVDTTPLQTTTRTHLTVHCVKMFEFSTNRAHHNQYMHFARP